MISTGGTRTTTEIGGERERERVDLSEGNRPGEGVVRAVVRWRSSQEVREGSPGQGET